MVLPVYLYHPEHGKSKQPVYPMDLSAWFDHGWSIEPSGPALKVVPSDPQPPVAVTQTKAQYQTELYSTYRKDNGWREIAKIAAGLGVEKHNDGWEETIPAIADKKYG